LALFVVLCVLFSSVLTSELKIQLETPCESKCLACQQAAYNLKFHRKANCKSTHCRSTCQKVWSMWSSPGSLFASFQNDSVGKCDACFRSGFCTISECQVQKNYETAIINQVVDQAPLNGVVSTKSLKGTIGKIMSNQKVNFKKLTAKVMKNLSKAKKSIGKRTAKRLAKTVSKVLKIGAADLNQQMSLADKKIKQFAKDNVNISVRIKGLLASFDLLVQQTMNSKKTKNAKIITKQRANIRKMHSVIQKIISDSIVKLNLQVTQMKGIQTKISQSNDIKVKITLKKINAILVMIVKGLKEAEKADSALKTLQLKANSI